MEIGCVQDICRCEQEEPKQDFILVKEECSCIDECLYYLSKQCKHLKEEPKQENCCTPVGQIKRYVDCVGCDRKPKQETTLEEAIDYYSENWEKINPDLDFEDLTPIQVSKVDFSQGAKWQQEQILDFLYEEITERRDYSASKMCEKVIEFIEQFKNK
jgi:hypothetical protein